MTRFSPLWIASFFSHFFFSSNLTSSRDKNAVARFASLFRRKKKEASQGRRKKIAEKENGRRAEGLIEETRDSETSERGGVGVGNWQQGYATAIILIFVPGYAARKGWNRRQRGARESVPLHNLHGGSLSLESHAVRGYQLVASGWCFPRCFASSPSLSSPPFEITLKSCSKRFKGLRSGRRKKKKHRKRVDHPLGKTGDRLQHPKTCLQGYNSRFLLFNPPLCYRSKIFARTALNHFSETRASFFFRKN